MAKLLVSGIKNYKLETLCANYGVINERAHDAMSDVFATASILKKFIKDLKTTQIIRKTVLQKNKKHFKKFYLKFKEIKEKNISLKEFLNCIIQDFNLIYKGNKMGEINANKKLELVTEKILQNDNGNINNSILNYIENLNEGTVSSYQVKQGQIPILTIHQSKGMEFDNVFLVGMDNFTFPDGVVDKDNEQRRIFYVAITRPKKRLFITYSLKNKFNNQNFPSNILKLLKID